MEKRKELQKLKSQKQKYIKQGNIKVAAEYANSIGNLYCEIGEYKEAINEHETELSYCQDLKDVCGEAVACRRLGECYTELFEFETALEYVNKYIALAKSLPNKEELQRGYMTLGRLHLSEISTISPLSDKFKVSSKRTEAAFLRALEWTDKLKTTLKPVEYHDMKARALLNLGLLAELRNEEKESKANIKNAMTIARKYSLTTLLVMCHVNLAQMLVRSKDYTEARATLEEAMVHAKQTEFDSEVEIAKLLAQISVEIGDVGKGLETVKNVMRAHTPAERDELKPTAIKMFKIIRAKNQLASSNDEDKCKIYEKIADYCCELGANHQAIASYQKTLNIMNQLKLAHDKLAPILSSIAQTYQDVKLYTDAINFYCQEVKIQKGLENYEQACKSLLSIAQCMEIQSCNPDMVVKCYVQAEANANRTQDGKLKLLVLRNFADYCKTISNHSQLEACLRTIQKVKTEHNITCDSQEESQNQSPDDNNESSDGDFELSEHSDEEQVEAEVVRSTRMKAYKILKNEVGETKLHQAIIKGKKDMVIDLLKKGHPVDIRDHAGWLPLHEAANHNRVDLARLLINFGSDVNDRGGEKCRGVTPLMDACSAGGCEMIQLLLDNGADVIAKDDANKYPLDALMVYRQSANHQLDKKEQEDLDEIEEMLRCAMIRKGIKPKTKPFKELLKEKDAVTDNMASINPPLRGNLGLAESDDEEGPKRPDISLSPQETATDMYRNTIANVRKSGKRATIPHSSTQHAPNQDSEAALLPADCDVDLAATGDWLVNDTDQSPVKKKPRISDPPTCNTRRARNSRGASVKGAKLTSPERTSNSEPDSENPGDRDVVSRSPSPVISLNSPAKSSIHNLSIDLVSPAKSDRESSPALSSRSSVYDDCTGSAKRSQDYVLSPTRSEKSTDGREKVSPAKKKARSREVSPAMSAKSSIYEDAAPVPEAPETTKAQTSEKKTRSARSRIKLPSMSPDKDLFTQASQPLTPAFNGEKAVDSDVTPTNTPQKENIRPAEYTSNNTALNDKISKPGLDAIAKTDSQSSGQQADTQSLSQKSPSKPRPRSPHSIELERVQIPMSTNHQSESEEVKHSSPSSVRSAMSIEWSQPRGEEKTGRQSPNISAIHRAELKSDSASSRDKQSESILDEFIGEPVAKQAKVKTSRQSTNQLLPSSTPLRNSHNLVQHIRASPATASHLPVNRLYSNSMTSHNEAKDSGYPQDSFAAPNTPFNTSMSTIRGPVREASNTSMMDSSYYHNIRILVQWKNRTLLIPIPRCESPSIGWLCEELVRRLSRRKQSQGGVPDPQQIILTRATDGAELFNEDSITDILIDNEKVVALDAEEDS